MKLGDIELGKIPVVVGTIASELDVSVGSVDKVDVFEIRVDMFRSTDIAFITKTLRSISDVYAKPLIVTVRSKAEGGAIDIDDNSRYEIIKAVIHLSAAIDVELSSKDLLKKVSTLCKKEHKLLIASYHNFKVTPDETMLDSLVADGKSMGADIVKLAVKANSKEDLTKLTSYTIKNKGKALITISQGSIGTISRIFNPFIGSLMTYGYIDIPSAKGQLSAFDIIEQLRIFDATYNENLITRVQLMEAV